MLRTSAIAVLSSLVLVTTLASAPSQAQTRGSTPEPTETAPLTNGKYYALVIGINDYPAPLPKLKTAASDASAVAALLTERYGFNVKLLLNGEATRGNILDSLNQYENTVTANDSLLIYFAGHGYENKLTGKAYWLPSDAGSVNSSNRIIADDITSEMVALTARHILIISDSCYSGGLSRDADVITATMGKDALLRRMITGKSRTLMASGGDEPVSDSGKEGHSAFAYALLDALKTRQEAMFSAGDLFYTGVQRRVAGNSEQVPHYDVIRSSGHEDGDFVFLRKGATTNEAASLFHPETAPADDLREARTTYYTPTSNGLQSFHCDVKMNWKKVMTETSDDDPYLVWLNHVHMSIDDTVKTAGKAQWTSDSPPPADAVEAESKMQGGVLQMLEGFLQTWNGFMNGSMVPEPDNATTVSRNGDGLHLHAASENETVDEMFDKNVLLTESHVVLPNMDVEMYPTYMQTSDGKVVSSVRSVYRISNAPGTELTMAVTYNTIDSFYIPATLQVNEKNVGNFDFTFSNCTVKRF